MAKAWLVWAAWTSSPFPLWKSQPALLFTWAFPTLPIYPLPTPSSWPASKLHAGYPVLGYDNPLCLKNTCYTPALLMCSELFFLLTFPPPGRDDMKIKELMFVKYLRLLR